jgi:DUF438 domain-containing protein
MKTMPHRSNSGSGNQVLATAGSDASLLSESEQAGMTERVNVLTKEADDVRTKIQELDAKYDTSKMTAKQHDKLVKQYLLKLFDVNRELLPLKERIQKDGEERERQRIREKLEATGVKVKAPKRHKKTVKKTVSRKGSTTKTRSGKKNARR